MFKKIGLPLLALAGVLVAAPRQAKAGVRFGIAVGAPAYNYYPAYPDYPVYPPVPAPAYVAPAPAYVYPGPAYVAPYRAWDRWEDRREHRRAEWREHEYREHDGYRRDWR